MSTRRFKQSPRLRFTEQLEPRVLLHAASMLEGILEPQVVLIQFDDQAETSPGDIQLTDRFQGEQSTYLEAFRTSLQNAAEALDVQFVEEPPSVGEYSTVYIESASTTDVTEYWGLSSAIDIGNQDHSDEAHVFSQAIASAAYDAEDFGRLLAGVVAHEVGHLLGHEHSATAETENHQDELAFKPVTHIEVAIDVRNDLLEDGRLDVWVDDAGRPRSYEVHPRIVEAIKKYPAYYFAGAVGPDGFPDLLMGQAVIHPDSTGIWIGHALDKAWEAQTNDAYSPEEKLQILAWGYGFPTHAIGDTFAHTLVNEFTGGPFPGFVDVATKPLATSNAVRHFLAEAYIGDATVGIDGIKDNSDDETVRDRLPDGDVSTNASVSQPLNAPAKFVFDTFINDLPNLAGHREVHLFQLIPSDSISSEEIEAIFKELDARSVHSTLQKEMQTQAKRLASGVSVDVIRSGEMWDIKSEFDSYTVKRDQTAKGEPVLQVFRNERSRGIPINFVLSIREKLELLKFSLADAGGLDPNQTLTEEPLGALVDRILEEGERLLEGNDALNTDRMLDDLKTVGETIVDSFRDTFQNLVAGGDVTTGELESIAQGLGGNTIAYLNYWIENIDRGLEHWSDLGLAVSRSLFDPQSKRDLQNKIAESKGADVDTEYFLDRRIEEEGEVGVIDVLLDELSDPNDDGSTEDSFVNQYLLPMFGFPRKIGELKTGIESFIGELEDKVLDPASQLLGELNPIEPLVDWIKEEIKQILIEFLRQQILDRFGFDIEIFDILNDSMATKMDLKAIIINGEEFPVFRQTDRDRMDSILGFTGTGHRAPLGLDIDPSDPREVFPLSEEGSLELVYFPGADGGLKDNAEFAKGDFAAYDNAVTLAKLLLLQETLVDEDPINRLQPKTISRLLTDLTGKPYDFGTLNNNGDHGGNILTATMPDARDEFGNLVDVTEVYSHQPVDSDLWLTSIDTDHTWRIDSRTEVTQLYRHHFGGTGSNIARWDFTGLKDGKYKVQVDWRFNIKVTEEGSLIPTKAARYTVNGGSGSTNVLINQRSNPDDEVVFPGATEPEATGQSWENLGDFDVLGGSLSVSLSDFIDAGEGDFVIAGRVRIVPTASPADAQIMSSRDTGYSEAVQALDIWSASASDLAAMDSGNVPNSLKTLLADELDDSDSLLVAEDFVDESVIVGIVGNPLVDRLRKSLLGIGSDPVAKLTAELLLDLGGEGNSSAFKSTSNT